MVEKTSGWDSKNLWRENHPDFFTSLKSTTTTNTSLVYGWPPTTVICFESQLFDGCSLGLLVEWAQPCHLNHPHDPCFFCVEEVEILMNQWQHTHTLIQCVYRPKKDVFKACINWKWKCMWLIVTGYHYQLLQKFSTIKDGKIHWAMCVVLIRSSTCSKAVPGKRLVSGF